jgi:hypothetical protein
VGWSYSLNVSALAGGSHTLKIVAADSAGNSGSSQLTFTTQPPVLPSVWIDNPVANAMLSGTVAINGWAIENTSVAGPNAVTSVAVLLDGTQVGTAISTSRPDVCAALPGRLGCPNVGWSYSLDVSALAGGSHTLQIVATDSVGNTGSNQVSFVK